ncbi:MAG: alpha/beta fold hydrolase [Chloroflexi bacterium]|nr:alpha/beta fold hydrolase [Chloroflexota bacterium]
MSVVVGATAADLPPPVAAALRSAAPDLAAARLPTIEVEGIPWATYGWGTPADPPVILVHGVTSNAETFWRIGPAIAATGRFVVAVDMPGHGRTGHWQGRHRFAQSAEDLAGWTRAAGFAEREPAVLGHSWGGLLVAALPAAGLRPGRLLLLDPPAMPVAAMELMTHDPLERPYAHLADAVAAIEGANPGWSDGDIRAKALGLTQFDADAVLAILLENGDWDGGLGALADPAAAGVPTWLIRGEFLFGGMPASGPEATTTRSTSAIAAAGLRPRGHHHEIYLGDPRRSAPERLRTIIRMAVE